MQTRRRFVQNLAALTSATVLPSVNIRSALAAKETAMRPFGDGEIWSITDGQLNTLSSPRK